MTLTGKAITGVVTTGLIGGASVGGYYAFSNSQTISGRLQDEGFEPLDFSKTQGDWKTVLDAYKQAKINTFEGSTNSTEDENGLKAKCRVALNSKSDNSSNYSLAKQWCVKERTAENIFEKLKLRALKTEPETVTGGSSTNPDDKYWNKQAEKYNSKQFNVAIEITPPLSGQAKVTGEQIKNACKTLKIGELKTTTDKFNETIEKAKEWCTVSKDAK